MTTKEFIDNFKENTGRLPSYVELSKALKLSAATATQELIRYTRVEVPKVREKAIVSQEKRNLTVSMLRGFLILLSAMAFTLSVYFTGLWFSGRFHIIISGLISLTMVMVMFMVISPQVLRFVNSWFVKAIVILSFCIALLFSMGSTIAGQYQKTTERIEMEPDKSFIFNQLTNNEQEVQELIEDAQRDKEVHQETIRNLSTTEEARKENWQSIATERKYIASFDERIDSLREELKSVRNDQVDNGIIEEKRDFYIFIAELMKIEDKSLVEFVISALPAVFIDIISALCLNLALFIKKKE